MKRTRTHGAVRIELDQRRGRAQLGALVAVGEGHAVAGEQREVGGSSARSASVTQKPSTSVLSPPLALEDRQCSSCSDGTGSR